MPSNIVDYGTAQRPNLEAIKPVVTSALEGYEQLLNQVQFRKEFTFLHTPQKTTTARAVTDVLYQGQKVGDLYVILFAPGDGTGKEEERSPYIYQVPPEYYFEDKPERILPRDKLKEKVLLEVCFPLATVEGRYVLKHLIGLEQITVDNAASPTTLVKGVELGGNASFKYWINNQPVYEDPEREREFPIYLTCGYRRNGQRFGDPHATFYNPKLAEGRPNLMQVAGFLAVEKEDNPLCALLDKIAIAPQ